MTIIDKNGKGETKGTVIVEITYDTPDMKQAKTAIVETARRFERISEYIGYAKTTVKSALGLDNVIFTNPAVIDSDNVTIISLD